MILVQKFREVMSGILQPCQDEFRNIVSTIRAWSNVEHLDDGTHSPNVGNLESVTAGQQIGGGQVVYIESGANGRAPGEAYLADAAATTKSTQALVRGIATVSAQAGQIFTIRRGGIFSGYAGLTAGAPYFVSATTPGSIVASKPTNAVRVGLALTGTDLMIDITQAATIATNILFAVDNSADLGTSSGVSSKTVSFAINNTNALLVVCVTGDTTSDLVTGVTYNGVAMTLVTKKHGTAALHWIYMFYLLNPMTGTHNVVISASGSCDSLGGVALAYDGEKLTSQPDTSTTNSGTSVSTLSTSLTPGLDGALEVAFGITGSVATTVAGVFTQRVNAATSDNGFFYIAADKQNITPASSQTFIISNAGTNTDWGTIVASFKPGP